jgi:tetratricopeptide (TPR) repeat protein
LRDDAANPIAPYQAELDAAASRLGAEREDLEPLFVYVLDQQLPWVRVPGVLGQAYSRLTSLRAHRAAGTRLAAEQAAVVGPIERAHRALQTGDAFSLDAADQAFEEAVRASRERGSDEPGLVAHIRAARAAIAALRQEYRRAAELYAEAAATPALPAPAQWRYQHERASILEELGRELGDNAGLEEAIELYEHTVLPLAPREERPEDWAATQHSLGNALGVLGQRSRGIRQLERSVTAFEHALSERTRERAPLDWAATQNGLGNVLGILAQRQGDTDMLARSVDAFERALEARSQAETPQDWAKTQNNLGTALLTLGQLKGDTALLDRSVEAYRSVLQEWTREGAPLDWATTLHNLGTALRVVGERREDADALETAVVAYRDALAERTRERTPQDWAMTQNNLGAALQRLGERRGDTQILSQAVTAYEHALEEWDREDMPMAWAMTKANLGVTRRDLAEREGDIEIARRAIADFEAAVEVFEGASHPQYHWLAKEQLVQARALAAGLEEG